MELLTLEHFSGCVNQSFTTRLDDVNLEFVLVEARPIGAAAPHPMRKPFSLLFRNLRIPLAEGVTVWPPDGLASPAAQE